MRLRWFILVRCPYVHVVSIALWSQQFSVHRWRSYHRYFTWMTDYLLHFDVWVLFRSIVVKYRLQFRNQIMILLWYLNIGQHNVIWIVGPCTVCWIVNTVSFAWEVNSLIDYLGILINQRTPLKRCRRPVQKVFIYEMVKIFMIFAPQAVGIKLLVAHYIFFIYFGSL